MLGSLQEARHAWHAILTSWKQMPCLACSAPHIPPSRHRPFVQLYAMRRPMKSLARPTGSRVPQPSDKKHGLSVVWAIFLKSAGVLGQE